MTYIIFGVITILFIIYLYYKIKIRNSKNYPITLAMWLAFLVITSNESFGWIIKTINKYSGLEIEIPHSLSLIEIIVFFMFLYGLSALYYKYAFGKIYMQKNFIFSIFQIGNNEQNNKR